MRAILALAGALLVLAPDAASGQAGAPAPASAETQDPRPIVLVIHGGAGTILRSEMSPEQEAEVRAALTGALVAGREVLLAGGSSLDAVEQAIRRLEDSPLFNAGKGAVFTAAGRNELDAAIMEGPGRRAGAVTGVTRIKNPISAARAVMERTPHVMLAGAGAEELAVRVGLELVDPSYFFTQRRWDSLLRERGGLAPGSAAPAPQGAGPGGFGTVGALALDRAGRLAAGTSTGGTTNKLPGRVGDTPILGAGTWADEECAVSGTGHGESFMRWAVAHDICARVRYRGQSLAEAAAAVVLEVLPAAGGSGGVIALDRGGEIALPFNTEGMYRGWVRDDSEPRVEIYR